MKISRTFKGIGSFFRKNAYYVILFVCIAGIATMITLAALSNNNNGDNIDVIDNNNNNNDDDDDDNIDDVDGGAIIFASPVANYELGMGYSGNNLILNVTLGDWRTHRGIDFKTASGVQVLACYGGTVESVTTDSNNGTTIIIKHNNDLKSVYKSLSSDVDVKAGDIVAKGEAIGFASETLLNEIAEGPHLHFEVLYQNAYADPMTYFDFGDK